MGHVEHLTGRHDRRQRKYHAEFLRRIFRKLQAIAADLVKFAEKLLLTASIRLHPGAAPAQNFADYGFTGTRGKAAIGGMSHPGSAHWSSAA